MYLAYTIFVEFDKMQIPLKVVYGLIHTSFKISLATIGVCVFMRWLRSAHFLRLYNLKEKF